MPTASTISLPIYLDNNATTPVDPQVLEAFLPFYTTYFGNAASRNHSYGWQAAEAVNRAREQVAELINADPSEITFTSGATESDNLAIKGVFETYASKGRHIITTNIEHKAVLDTCKHLEKQGAEVTYLPVNANGVIAASQVEAAIRPDTILIAVMYANNEIGTIMPITDIGAIAKKHGVLFFTDATQAVGKIPVNVSSGNIDLLAMTAHKMYGPKGVGALYVRRRNPRVKLTAQIDGGGHEKGTRSGTLNVPGIVGLGKAAALCQQHMATESKRLQLLRNKLESALLGMEHTYLNGDSALRLPHVTNVSFKHAESEALLLGLNKKIALSSGAACSSASLEPSYVLKALGLSNELAQSSLRFGLGRFTTETEIEYTIETVKAAVERLREMSPLWQMYKQDMA
jgi:cysteine desulfurase